MPEVTQPSEVRFEEIMRFFNPLTRAEEYAFLSGSRAVAGFNIDRRDLTWESGLTRKIFPMLWLGGEARKAGVRLCSSDLQKVVYGTEGNQ